ncbi:MAG: BON domain-containing protein [Vicinamibacterales bacterium]
MADRDRYDWDREREYGRGGDRGDQDRGMVSRGADEVRSWFGDDDARRRRDMDEQRERQQGERDYGANSERARREHGWGGPAQADPGWQSGRSGAYGDQRDFVSRGENWTGARNYSPRGRDWFDPGYERDTRWQGGSRDYGDEDSRRRSGNSQYSGSNYTAGQTNPGFAGGYGAGSYDSGSTSSGSPGPYGAYRGYGSQGGFGPGTSGWDNFGSGRSSSANYSAGGGFSGATSGGTFAGRGPRNYHRSDDRIREDVNECLTADPRIDASEIDVSVQNGEVILGGTVDERRTRRLAEEIIEDLPGVRDVRNEIKVSKGGRFGSDHDRSGAEGHRQDDTQARAREDGAIGRTGDPQRRDDVTTINTTDTKR